MTAPNFPNNPTIGQQFVVGNNTFQWDGEKWKALSNADSSLRTQLAAPDSDVLVGGVEAGDLARRYGEIVSVKDFGAKGDGVTDDTMAIQSAIDFVQSRGGGDVHVPYSRNGYVIGSNIVVKKGVLLKGEGAPSNGAYLSNNTFGQGSFTRTFFICDSIGKGSSGFTVQDNAGMDCFGFYYKTVNTQITSGTPPEFGWTITASGFGYSLTNLSTLGASYFINLESFERAILDNISGLVTRVGIRMRRSRDTGRIDNVHFNPNITFPSVNGASSESFSAYFLGWLKSNATVVRYGSADVHFIGKILSFGHKFGIHIVPDNHQDYYDDGITPLGIQFDNYTSAFNAESLMLDACKFPIYIERRIGFTSKIANADLVPINDDGGGVGVTMTTGSEGLLQITNLFSKGTSGQTTKQAVLDSSGVSMLDVINGRYINPGNDNLVNDVSNLFTVSGNNRLSTGIVFSKTNAVGVYRHIQYANDAVIFPQGIQTGRFSIERDGEDALDFIQRNGADVKTRVLSIDNRGGLRGRTAALLNDDATATFDIRSASNPNGRAFILVSADFPGHAAVIAYVQGTTLYPVHIGANAAAASANPDTDGLLNVFISSAGIIGVKNRLGSARSVTVALFPSI